VPEASKLLIVYVTDVEDDVAFVTVPIAPGDGVAVDA
jgi:hypothetical protein